MHGKKYEELTFNELLQLIEEYRESNRYNLFYSFNTDKCRTKEDLVNLFESRHHIEWVLIKFFNEHYN